MPVDSQLPPGVADALFALGFAVFAALLLALGLRWLATAWQFRTARTAATDLTDGAWVELEGEARPFEETLSGPFSGEPALAYEYRVKERRRRRRGGPGSEWRTVDRGSAGVPFRLDTDDGAVLVRADRDPEFVVEDDVTRFDTASGDEPPAGLRDLAAERAGERSTLDVDVGPAPLDGRRRKYVERRLEPGETAFVAGRAASPDTVDAAGVEAVVGPPHVDGLVEMVRRRIGALPFVIADAPAAETARRALVKGAVATLLGLAFGGGLALWLAG